MGSPHPQAADVRIRRQARLQRWIRDDPAVNRWLRTPKALLVFPVLARDGPEYPCSNDLSGSLRGGSSIDGDTIALGQPAPGRIAILQQLLLDVHTAEAESDHLGGERGDSRGRAVDGWCMI